MTARQVYEGVLVELNKVNAPSLLLEDFNYLFNKAIYQYINKKYNIYDINQQLTDDIRVLKSTTILPVQQVTSAYGSNTSGNVTGRNSLFGATYEVILPADYLHLLNCICNFHVTKKFKCYDEDTYVQFGATRLTSDIWSQIINNFYMRPSYKRPYYYIHNVNQHTTVPTNPIQSGTYTPRQTTTVSNNYPTGTYDSNNDPLYYVVNTTNSGDPVIINGQHIKSGDNQLYYAHVSTSLPNGLLSGTDANSKFQFSNGQITNINLSRSLLSNNDLVEKDAAVRYGNASEVRLEIRAGKDQSLFKLEDVYVDYLKAPQHIRLTQEQLDYTEDFSQMMEFPDYVCQEIINELVKLVMENSGDPRLQSNIAVNQSIANPVQQQQETK